MFHHQTQWINLPSELRVNRPCFVTSDVHGHAEHMMAALSFAASSSDGHELILLGDLVDRGPRSADCIRMAMAAKDDPRFSDVVMIMGNHEQVLADYVADPNVNNADSVMAMGDKDIVVACNAERQLIVKPLIALLREYVRGLAPYHVNGGLAFCHAIPDPSRRLIDQTEVCLFWNKSNLEYRGGWRSLINGPCVLVHGHVRNAGLLQNNSASDFENHISTLLNQKGRICCDAGTPNSGELHLYEFIDNRFRCHVFTNKK